MIDSIDRIKRTLAAKGVNVHTVEGAFEITKRFAWEQRHAGTGLLLKPGGDNIVEWKGRFFSAGRICYPDGHIVKILTDIPTTNGPSWQDEGEFVATSRYVAAMDPGGDEPAAPPAPPPPPPPPPVNLSEVLARLDALNATVQSLAAAVTALAAQPHPPLRGPFGWTFRP